MTNKQFLKKNKWILKHWKTYRQMTQEFERNVELLESVMCQEAQKHKFDNAFFTYADEGIFGIQVGGKYGDSKSGKLIHDSELDKEAK